MAPEPNKVATLNFVMAAIGVLLVAVGFVTSSVAGAASTSTLFPGATTNTYPYFSIGVIIVVLGMAFVASGLIYSPRKAEFIKET